MGLSETEISIVNKCSEVINLLTRKVLPHSPTKCLHPIFFLEECSR